MSDSAGSRCGDENGLETSVAIDVQPPRGHGLVAPNDSTFTHLILGAGMSDNGQTAVTPELTFGSESMGSAGSSDNLSGPDWTHLWNRSQQLDRLMALSFGEHCSLCSFPKFTNVIQLFIEPGRSLLHSHFDQLLQPIVSLFLLVNGRALRRNTATTIERFDSHHRSSGINSKRFVSPNHLLQATCRLAPMPDQA